MARPESIWSSLRKGIRRARRKFREGDADGLHDVRVALRRAAVVAEAGNRPKVARGASELVRRLSSLRQLEVNRELVSDLARSGALAPQDARSVDALLASRYRRSREKAVEALSGARARKLDERLGHERRNGPLASRLARRAEEALPASSGLDEKSLHRLRIAVKKRRYALMARRDLGVPGLESEIARWEGLQDVLGRANDWRSFRRDLVRLREHRRVDPADPALDAVFDLATDRADQALTAARDAVAASALVPRAAETKKDPATTPRRPPRARSTTTSLLRGPAALSRADS